MALEYRPLAPDDERFDRYVRYAFRPQAGPHTDDEERRDLSDLLARRGLFEADDWRDLAAVHRAQETDRALFVEREEAWWRQRVFRGWETDPYVYVWERDGEPRGYVAYVVEEVDDDRRLNVRELVSCDDKAYRQLLRFLGNHDSQVASVRTYGPPETGLLDRVAAPDEVDCEIHAGPMARVEDVAAGLSALDYPDVSVDVTFRVDDPLADANAGTYALTVEGGSGQCRPTDAEPAVELGVGTLAQLCVGYRRARELATLGDLTGSQRAVTALDRAFPPEEPFLREGF